MNFLMLSCSIGILDHLSRQVSEDDAKPRVYFLHQIRYGLRWHHNP